MWGGFAVWMDIFSVMILVNYVKNVQSATIKPYVYWAVSGWTMLPVWTFSWGLWVANLIFDNQGGKLHFFWSRYTLFYMLMPVLIQPIYIVLIILGYGTTTIPISSDSSFWPYWTTYLLSDLLNFVVFYTTLYGI